MKAYFPIIIILAVTLASCKKDECTEEEMPTKHFESEFGCVNTKDDLEIEMLDNVMLIRSAEIYDNQVTGSCHPEIDFTQYDLVIGNQTLNSLNDTITYEYVRTCPGTVLSLTIDLLQSSTIAADTVVYHALIPKLSDTETISVNLTIR